jgi:ADP-heptose:LPS heptosyltransferase
MKGVNLDLLMAKCYIFARLMSMNSFETLRAQMTPPRVCVLFPGALGDFICFLPALHELTKSYAVDLLARSDFAAIAPHGVRVLSLERFEVRQLFMADGASDQRLSQFFAGYAAIYSWFASQQPMFVDQLQTVAQGRAQIFPFRPDPLPGHQADYYLACLNGALREASAPLVALRGDAQLWCDAFCQRAGFFASEPLLIVAPGSGAREKNWPEAHFLQIVHWWRERLGGKAVVVAGPVEMERGGYEQLASACVIASGLDLAQLAALLARGDLYIGNDSGVSHLAAAVGCRTVALFGPSDERQWAPRGQRVTILRRTFNGSFCGAQSRPSSPDRADLAELTPAQVIQELSKLPEAAKRWQRSP